VDTYFRIYSRSPQALAHNVSPEGQWSENRFTNPIRPGRQLVLWGTGLGPVEGDEAAGPVPVGQGIREVELLVGLQPARVLYAGRSGCCPGLDQVIVEVPAGIEGCNVPVVARTPNDEAEDAFPTVAISSRAGICSDPGGMNETALRAVETNGSARIGWVYLGGEGWFVPDGIGAIFSRHSAHHVMPAGTCGYPRWTAPATTLSAFLDAGAELIFTGPSEERVVPPHEDYNSELLGSIYTLPFESLSLVPGAYSLHNGSGGRNIGPFRLSIPVSGPSFQWTNRDDLIPARGEDLRLSWSAPAGQDGFVQISGGHTTFKLDPNGYGLGGFNCIEQVSKGGFTVPAWVAWPGRSDPADTLHLQLTYFTRSEFTAPGLDFGSFTQKKHVERVSKPIPGGAR